MSDKTSDPYAQTVAFLGLAGLFSLIISFYQGFHLPDPIFLPNFLLMTILLTFAPLLIFKAYQVSGAAEVNILGSSQQLWVVLLAVIVLGETLTVSKLTGTLLILSGIMLVSWEKRKFHFNKGTFFALFGALLYGISSVNAFYILRNYDAASFEVLGNWLPVITLLIIRPKTLKKISFYRRPKNFINVSTTAFFDSTASISLLIAYQLGRNASQISPLSATPIIITTILAAIFLKERKNLLGKITGACIVVIGSILLL